MGAGAALVLARNLTEAFYELSALEFFEPQQIFEQERQRDYIREQIQIIQAYEFRQFQDFVLRLAAAIAGFCNDPARNSGVLYRAFDGLDELLAIDYKENREQVSQHTSVERLYGGGGVGVQTSYSTIFRALHSLQLPLNAHLVDLGSGFGRIGLAAGLWRPDLRFSGYEFVAHRVDISNRAAKRAGIDSRVQFFCQNLSDPTFEIPAADVFYLYDPFSVATYQRVMARLAELGRTRRLIVIAKAGARESFRELVDQGEWLEPTVLDDGTLSVFRS